MRRASWLSTLTLSALLLGCAGSTGGTLRDFPSAASGTENASTFTSDLGWLVTLSEAKLHVGAWYLDQNRPVSGAQDANCVLPGSYVAEETSGRDVDLLSTNTQYFPTLAHGSTQPALVGQVWLTGADVNEVRDATPILLVTGTAQRSGQTLPFHGQLTIGDNFAEAGLLSSGAPICKQRIVSPIAAPLAVEQQGGISLCIDARLLFVNVDFASLAASPASDGTFSFSDEPGSASYTQASRNLFNNLRSSAPYSFSWSEAL